MKKKFTGEQIAFALKQAEHGTPVAEVIRKMGTSLSDFILNGHGLSRPYRTVF